MADARLNDMVVIVGYKPEQQARMYDLAVIVGYRPEPRARLHDLYVVAGYVSEQSGSDLLLGEHATRRPGLLGSAAKPVRKYDG